MSDPTGPFLSVRGDARQTVAPDYVTLASTIDISRGSKGEALRAAAARLDHLIADLATLGAEALSVETERRPLTWSAQSATTYAEREHNDQTGHYEPTGRVTATVAVLIAVRDFGLLAAIRKGRDYAAALGGSLRSVEHIADVGLLGGGEATQYRSAGGRRAMSASGGREPDTPSLDPVPQELTATIEARFIATGVSLTGADGGELGAT